MSETDNLTAEERRKLWECPICAANLAWPQPTGPSCPEECPLRQSDMATPDTAAQQET